MFGTDQALGVTHNEEGQSVLPSGLAAVVCTFIAQYIVSISGGCVMGFSADENPDSLICQKGYEGHDFAIVDNRFIVDPWIKLVETYSEQCVFDMECKYDQPLIKKFYGDKNKWTQIK